MKPAQMPTVEMPRALERATLEAAERAQELEAAWATLEAAQQALAAAREADVRAAAIARDEGAAHDPPPDHERAARRSLDEAMRERDVRTERAKMADERVRELLGEHVGGWERKVLAEWKRADTALRRKLSEVEAALERRAELTVAASWLRAVAEGGNSAYVLRKASARSAQAGLDLQELRAAIDRGSIESVTEALERSEREQREARERDQEEAERHLAEAQAERERERERWEQRSAT